jgi:hypothetical protein
MPEEQSFLDFTPLFGGTNKKSKIRVLLHLPQEQLSNHASLW